LDRKVGIFEPFPIPTCILIHCLIFGVHYSQDEIWPTVADLEKPDFVCLGCQLFGSTFNATRLRLQTGKYQKVTDHNEVLHHFLAIDRFTGRGKKGAKFDAYPLYNVAFTDCQLIIEDFQPWQIGLLALVFKDLWQADLRMGFGTRKGFGQVVGFFDEEKEILLSTPDQLYRCRLKNMLVDRDLGNHLKAWLNEAVKEFRKRVTEFPGVTYADG